MRKIFNILILVFTLIVSVSVCDAATIYGGTQPGKMFHIADNWTYSAPGTWNENTNVYSITNNSVVIDGYVLLDGDLSMNTWNNLTINDNSIFIINGDLNITDKSNINLGKNSTLYIKGDLNITNGADNYWYLAITQDNNSNVIIEQDLITQSQNGSKTNGRNAYALLYPYGNNTDFYVFGNISNNVYTTLSGYTNDSNKSNNDIGNESDYSSNESDLSVNITNIENAIIEENNCTTLNIPDGTTYRLVSDETYCYLNIGSTGTLLIEKGATLTITKNNLVDNGTIINYGTIDFGNNDFTIIPRYNDYPRVNCRFNNNGYIKANNFYLGTNNSDATKANTQYFSFSCGSSIIANEEISFTILGWTGDMSLLGDYKANKMIIDYQSGGRSVNFGNECGNSTVELKELTLINNISEININEITGLETINVNTYNPIVLNVDGVLTLGDITGKGVSVIGQENSIINVCYNPTHSTYNGGSTGDFVYNGQVASTKGKLIYRYDENDNEHSWYTDGSDNNPVIEKDFICNNCTMVANAVTLSECVNGVTNFLPISLTRFKFSDNEFIWETASETNNDYFVVEYSKNGKDWTECTDYIYSASTTGWTYTADPTIDVNASLFSYFRLKQVDYDGKFSYSDIITTSSKVTNPCSPDYEKYKVFLRETNQWYRLVNGELIYCENDN